MVSTESDVAALLDRRSEAARDKDIDRLMSVYSPDIVYFDLVPPLQYTGSAALRDRFLDWFGRWRGPIRQEIHELTVAAGAEVATASMLVRAGGTLNDGRDIGYWVRVSNGCRRSGSGWLIMHEHVSLPVDVASGRAVMDLVP